MKEINIDHGMQREVNPQGGDKWPSVVPAYFPDIVIVPAYSLAQQVLHVSQNFIHHKSIP